MNRLSCTLIGLTMILSSWKAPSARAASLPKLDVYQLGKSDGSSFCVSITADEAGCISGVDGSGNTKNTMDIMKGHQLVFHNLSNAYHNMVLSGRNADTMAAQAPNGPESAKQLTVVDPERQQITCSFHGPQLSFGYRVLEEAKGGVAAQGHNSPAGAREGDDSPGMKFFEPSRLIPTAFADVSSFIIRNGIPSEVERLLSTRPDLRATYKLELGQRGLGDAPARAATPDVAAGPPVNRPAAAGEKISMDETLRKKWSELKNAIDVNGKPKVANSKSSGGETEESATAPEGATLKRVVVVQLPLQTVGTSTPSAYEAALAIRNAALGIRSAGLQSSSQSPIIAFNGEAVQKPNARGVATSGPEMGIPIEPRRQAKLLFLMIVAALASAVLARNVARALKRRRDSLSQPGLVAIPGIRRREKAVPPTGGRS